MSYISLIASELHGTEHCTLLAQGSIEPRIIRAGAAEVCYS